MAGIETEFQGEAWAADGIKVGYLAQEPELDPSLDVAGNVLVGMGRAKQLVDRFNEVSAKFAEEMTDEEMNAVIVSRQNFRKKLTRLMHGILNGRQKLQWMRFECHRGMQMFPNYRVVKNAALHCASCY